MKFKTLVGKYQVEVRCSYATVAQFTSGAHGRKEAAYFAFWTAILRRPKRYGKRLSRKIFGRASVGISAGDRFDRMKREQHSDRSAGARRVYKTMWNDLLKRGANIRFIRPSTLTEVRKWMRTHDSDAKHCTGFLCADRWYRR